MLYNLIVCNVPHPVVLEEAKKKSLGQIVKSWYVIFFQVPVFPELWLMSDDIRSFDMIFDENERNDEEVKEVYRYAYRDYKTWNRTINYYRASMYKVKIKIYRQEWVLSRLFVF